MKYLRLFLAALAVLFAYFQLNDPDPWRWVALYLWVGLVLGISVWRPVPPWLSLSGLAVVGIWLVVWLPGFIEWLQMGMPTITSGMKAEEPHIELTREFLGLVLCGLGFWWGYRSQRP